MRLALQKSSRCIRSHTRKFATNDGSPSMYSIPVLPGFDEDVSKLANFVKDKERLVVITGAGISTESGIPDYRGPHGSYKNGHKPLTYQEFVKNTNAQKKYWARSMKAWPFFSQAKPGLSHLSLSEMERIGLVSHIITQNVDRLHHRAGHHRVLELHGTLHQVVCMSCKAITLRDEFQERLIGLNKHWEPGAEFPDALLRRPDGDVEFGRTTYDSFVLPECHQCGGALKPDVVLFGENCSKQTVDSCNEQIDQADSVLIVGSSCTVFSVYRLITKALQKNAAVALLNVGETRADSMVSLKIEQPSGPLLSAVFRELASEIAHA